MLRLQGPDRAWIGRGMHALSGPGAGVPPPSSAQGFCSPESLCEPPMTLGQGGRETSQGLAPVGIGLSTR